MALNSGKRTRKISKKVNLAVLIVLGLIILSLQFYGMFGRTTRMRDFSVTFEGGYRVFPFHQIPYQDFFIPFGPNLFYTQAFFNFLFGTSAFSIIIHAFVLAFILSGTFYFIVKKEMNIILSLIFAVFLYLSFNGLTFYAHYNEDVYFFFLLNILLLLNYYKKDSLPKYVYLLSALFCFFTFYFKQDLGILQILFISIYLFYNYKKEWKLTLFYFAIPFIIIFAISYLAFMNIQGFTYWFNLGQPPHESRISSFFDPTNIMIVLESWKFYLGLLFIGVLFFKKNSEETKKLLSLFILLAIITIAINITSGPHRQTSIQAVPIMVFIIYLLIKDYLNKNINQLIFGFIIVLLLLVLVDPFPTYGYIALTYLNKDTAWIKNGCYSGVPITKGALDGVLRIHEIIDENNKSFVSITEYSFLYCDYNLNPPKKVPIWWDEGISFFKQNIPELLDAITDSNPKIILYQDPHGHTDPKTNDLFMQGFYSKGYKTIEIINNTSSTVPIYVLSKDAKNSSISYSKYIRTEGSS
ncbi:Uncharacterised protein [uncultured archaeon]|nr:Uncharacterised protein [uncultured archaeon]